MQTKVQEVMTKNPETISPESSLKEAAQKMQSFQCGILPVGSKVRPEGIITDRDIVLRAVAEGKDMTQETVKDYMTQDVFYCRKDDTLEQAAQEMHKHHVNRLIVRDNDGTMCGILTFGSIWRKNSTMEDIHRVLESTAGKKAA